MKKSDTKFGKDLWAPFEALKGLLDLSRIPKDRLKVMEDSLTADLLGDDPVHVSASKWSNEAIALYYAILHLYKSIGRFEIYKKMFKYYPWKGRIKESEHIETAYYLFVHECYILEERLKKFLKAARLYAEANDIKIDLKSISSLVMKWHKRTFGVALRWRGKHVHEDEFVPREIDRIEILDVLITGGQAVDPDALKIWKLLQRRAIQQVKSTWIKNCESSDRASREIVSSAFNLTKPVWLHLAESNQSWGEVG